MDLTGPYNTTTQGNTYALTAICNLTGYLMTTPIPNKKTSTVAIHLFSEKLLKFSFSRVLHSNNRTEFTSKLIEDLTQQLGVNQQLEANNCKCQTIELYTQLHNMFKTIDQSKHICTNCRIIHSLFNFLFVKKTYISPQPNSKQMENENPHIAS